MKKLLFATLLLAACGGGESAPAPKAEAPKAPEGEAAKVDGKAIYDQYCVSCHQADGTGMGGKMAPDFTQDKARLAKADADLEKSVKDGMTGDIGTMPPWGSTLKDDQIKAVVGYMKATFGK